MRLESSGLKWLLMLAVATAGLLASRVAAAQTCVNDIDCAGDQTCGGPVCTWPDRTCTPAGTNPKKGEDGWCTMDTDCKCRGMGATCVSFFCTFTRACDAPGAAGCAPAGGGGASGTAGAGGSSSTGTGGSSSAGTGGAGTAGGGGGGGCAIGGAASFSLLGLVLAPLALVVARRRRQRAR